jgi:hypothetical protein
VEKPDVSTSLVPHTTITRVRSIYMMLTAMNNHRYTCQTPYCQLCEATSARPRLACRHATASPRLGRATWTYQHSGYQRDDPCEHQPTTDSLFRPRRQRDKHAQCRKVQPSCITLPRGGRADETEGAQCRPSVHDKPSSKLSFHRHYWMTGKDQPLLGRFGIGTRHGWARLSRPHHLSSSLRPS